LLRNDSSQQQNFLNTVQLEKDGRRIHKEKVSCARCAEALSRFKFCVVLIPP